MRVSDAIGEKAVTNCVVRKISIDEILLSVPNSRRKEDKKGEKAMHYLRKQT